MYRYRRIIVPTLASRRLKTYGNKKKKHFQIVTVERAKRMSWNIYRDGHTVSAWRYPGYLLRCPSTGRGHFPKHPSPQNALPRRVFTAGPCSLSRCPSSSKLFSLTLTISRLQTPHVFDDGTQSTWIASSRTY